MNEIAASQSSRNSSNASPGGTIRSPLRLGRNLASPAPEWVKLSADAYKIVPPLMKTNHGVDVDREAYGEKRFVQYTKEELEQDHLVTVDDQGQLCLGTAKEVITTVAEGMIFVMHTTGKIYATNPVDLHVFHSSLTILGESDYQDPISAGMFKALNGIPEEFNENSGHFAPENRLQYVLAKLYHEGCRSLLKCRIKENLFRPISPDHRASPDMREQRLKEILSRKSPSPIPDGKEASPPKLTEFRGFPSLRGAVSGIETPQPTRISSSDVARRLSTNPKARSPVLSHPKTEALRSLLQREAAEGSTSKKPEE